MIIRCPHCEGMVVLSVADWEEFTGDVPDNGKPQRINLICTQCRREYLLTLKLGLVIKSK